MRRSSVFALLPSFVLFAACGSDATNSTTSATTSVNNPAATVGATSDGGTVSPVSTGTVSTTITSTDGGASSDADAGTVVPEPSGPPAVQFLGRFDTRDPAGPKASWPGEHIIARFTGTQVSVTMNEIEYSWEEGTPSYWIVTIDGVQSTSPLIMKTGSNTYPLATGLTAGTHTVDMFKRSEAQDGTTQFLGYDFGSDGVLLAPPVRKTRRIEVIGDSESAGYGILGSTVGPNCPPPVEWSAYWEDYSVAYPTLLANALDAEVNGTIYSGKGLYENIDREDTDTMPLLFGRADPLDPNAVWDFTQFTPDAVIVMIGGNDFAIGEPDDPNGPTPPQDFTSTYTTFAATIRSKYPNAPIFLVTSPSVSDASPPGHYTRTYIQQGVAATVQARTAAGDTNIFGLTPPVAPADQLTACDNHGNQAFHQQLASELEVTLKQQLGWN